MARPQMLLACSLLAAAPSWAAEKPEPTPVTGSIFWVYDYQEGLQLSKKSGRPLFVVFRCER